MVGAASGIEERRAQRTARQHGRFHSGTRPRPRVGPRTVPRSNRARTPVSVSRGRARRVRHLLRIRFPPLLFFPPLRSSASLSFAWDEEKGRERHRTAQFERAPSVVISAVGMASSVLAVCLSLFTGRQVKSYGFLASLFAARTLAKQLIT